MMMGQARVVIVEEKWLYLVNVLKAQPTGFADRLDVWNAKREESNSPPS